MAVYVLANDRNWSICIICFKKNPATENRSGMTENGLLKAHFVRSASAQDRPPPTRVDFTERRCVV